MLSTVNDPFDDWAPTMTVKAMKARQTVASLDTCFMFDRLAPPRPDPGTRHATWAHKPDIVVRRGRSHLSWCSPHRHRVEVPARTRRKARPRGLRPVSGAERSPPSQLGRISNPGP